MLVEVAGDSNQRVSEIGKDAPVAVLVRVSQDGPKNGTSQAHVVELRLLGTEARFDIAQILAVGKLSKGQAEKLIEAGKALNLSNRRGSVLHIDGIPRAAENP